MNVTSIEQLPGTDEALAELRRQIESFRFTLRPVSIGTVTDVGDGIARISGLMDVMLGEMIVFD